MSTIKVNNIEPPNAGEGVSIDGLQMPTAGALSNRNLIINGAMVHDQRNSGVSGTAVGYTLDRWGYYGSQASKVTWQQNAGSVTPPAGYTNYIGVTSSSAYTLLAADLFYIYQKIEGYNIAHLNFGSASASAVTLSFWVRSSLTGTFGGHLSNEVSTRNYLFDFTISSANTWEQKTITVPGDTTGTWLTTNSTGLTVAFNLGTGSTYSGTANVWGSTQFLSAPTGATSVVSTNGATFYVTGVQLEVGSKATPFEHRSYGDELARCQRYYQASNINEYYQLPSASASQLQKQKVTFSVTMRANANVARTKVDGSATIASDGATEQGFRSGFGGSAAQIINYSWVATAEL